MAKAKKKEKPVVINASFEQLAKESVSGNPKRKAKKNSFIEDVIKLSVDPPPKAVTLPKKAPKKSDKKKV